MRTGSIKALSSIIVVVLTMTLLLFSVKCHGLDYQVLLPDSIELAGEHNWNSFNEYKFHQVGIKLIYHLKKPAKDKLIIHNVDNLHITKDNEDQDQEAKGNNSK